MGFVDLSVGNNEVNFGITKFHELRPKEEFASLRKIWDLTDEKGWVYHYHYQYRFRSTPPIVNAMGLYALCDLIVTRPAGMILNRKLGYFCDTGLAALKSMPAEDDLFEGSIKNKITIEEPVLIADGVSCEVFGHWIVDYLPRFGVAKDFLKEEFDEKKILLANYTPEWAIELLSLFLNINRDNLIFYNPDQDIILCKNAILPSYSYAETFMFHSYFKEFYRSLYPMPSKEEQIRKILISRSSCKESNRKFPLRGFFEQEALKRGYEIIHPEQIPILEQAKIFSEAKVVIGEHGSGMHNAVFSDQGTIVGCLGFWNAVQLHIGFVMEHQNVYLTKGCKWPDEHTNEYCIDCSEADIISFFGKIQLLLLDDVYS